MSEAPPGKMWVDVPQKERRTTVGVALGILIAGCAFIWWAAFMSGEFASRWWYVWPIVLFCAPIALFSHTRRRRLVPSIAAQEAAVAKREEQERKTREMEGKWWFRYPMAALMLGAAWYLAEYKNGVWLPGLLVLAAAGFARELALFVLGLGVIGLALMGLAAVPVPLAIIIAGGLVAYAVMRSKDPTIDTKIPIVGKLIARRRANLVAAELLASPYFQQLNAAIVKFWDNNPARADFNDALRQEFRASLVKEGMDIAASPDQVKTLREHLVEAVREASWFVLLVLPPPPEPDAVGLRGKPGITGEMKAHLLELLEKSPPLSKWLNGFEGVATHDQIYEAVLLKHWMTLARANVLSMLRYPLGDAHSDLERDWMRPFFESQCAMREYEFRELLGMPPVLAGDVFKSQMESMKLMLFVNFVLNGSQFPDVAFAQAWADEQG